MTNGNPDNPKYQLSFGTGGLHLDEAVALACSHDWSEAWDKTISKAVNSDIFVAKRVSSAKRVLREIGKKLRTLSRQEVLMFIEGSRDDQKVLMWVATCRAYRLIAEFAVEVVVARHASFVPDVTYEDFDAFFERKADWSEELHAITKSTRAKLRAVLFRLMREADIVSNDNQLLTAALSTRILDHLFGIGGADLAYFPGPRGGGWHV
jgi:hypothetical protein